MVIIETTFYLIFIPGDDPRDDDGDHEMSSHGTLGSFYEESKQFGLLT